MTVTEVAQHLGLDWKTVKAIDKSYLERDYGQPDYQGLSILAVDEISIRKGYRYLTVVLDYLSGRVVFVGNDRKAKTLERFFNIVFDLFHVVANFNRVIDKFRNSEYRKASEEDKAVYKGAKYLLLKNRKNVRRKSHRQQLKELLALNEVINTVMISQGETQTHMDLPLEDMGRQDS